MADHADEEDDGVNVFVYSGGRAPQHVTHARIDKSVDVIEENAFRDCEHLVQVETHDGIRRVGNWAFYNCKLLRQINLKSVVEIGRSAFWGCENLESVEFGDSWKQFVGMRLRDVYPSNTSSFHLSSPSNFKHSVIARP